MEKRSEFATKGDHLVIAHTYDDGDTANYSIPISGLGNTMAGTNGVSEWVNQLAQENWRKPEDLYELARHINRHADGHEIDWDETFRFIGKQNYQHEQVEYSSKNI